MKILMIGDALETDVRGAAAIDKQRIKVGSGEKAGDGLREVTVEADSLFVVNNGVHKDSLPDNWTTADILKLVEQERVPVTRRIPCCNVS